MSRKLVRGGVTRKSIKALEFEAALQELGWEVRKKAA